LRGGGVSLTSQAPCRNEPCHPRVRRRVAAEEGGSRLGDRGFCFRFGGLVRRDERRGREGNEMEIKMWLWVFRTGPCRNATPLLYSTLL
jgi:hypothetical protein